MKLIHWGFFVRIFCNMETTKVLKFPKIFGYFIEKQYLCTVFVRKRSALYWVVPCLKAALSYVYPTYMLRISYVYGT